MAEDRLFSKAELADYLGVSEAWVSKKVTARLIPHTRIGKHVRFAPHHVEAIVAMGEQSVVPPVTLFQLRQRKAGARRWQSGST